MLRAIDPRVKFACLLLYVVAAFHAYTAAALGVCLTAGVAGAFAVRLDARGFWSALRPLVPVLVVTLVVQVLYVQQGAVLVSVGLLVVTQGALESAARMLACLACLMLASVVSMRCTPVEDLTFALSWLLRPLDRVGLRGDALVFSLNVAFRFIPVLLAEFRQLKRAQESRLGSFDGGVRQRLGAYTRLFAPLVRSALRRADLLAEVSVTRGFGCGARPTSMRVRRLHARDALALLVTCALSLAVFAL